MIDVSSEDSNITPALLISSLLSATFLYLKIATLFKKIHCEFAVCDGGTVFPGSESLISGWTYSGWISSGGFFLQGGFETAQRGSIYLALSLSPLRFPNRLPLSR